MDVLKAIRTRRSVGRVKPDPVEQDKINVVLEAATWAPNHHRTEPWKFFVLRGEGRRPLGRTLAKIAQEESKAEGGADEQKIKQAMQKPFRAPVIIAVACIPHLENSKVHKIEEQAAVSAAIQNMLLAAHSLGLGAIWRTGRQCYHPEMKKLFGLGPEDELLGFIYLGYPEADPPSRERTSYVEKTVWIDTDTDQPFM